MSTILTCGNWGQGYSRKKDWHEQRGGSRKAGVSGVVIWFPWSTLVLVSLSFSQSKVFPVSAKRTENCALGAGEKWLIFSLCGKLVFLLVFFWLRHSTAP